MRGARLRVLFADSAVPLLVCNRRVCLFQYGESMQICEVVLTLVLSLVQHAF